MMDNQDLYDALYKILDIFPKAIVNIVFDYVTRSNKYKYAYTKDIIQWNQPIYNIYFNKGLGIIFCSTDQTTMFIDYNTGFFHDNSIIDATLFNKHNHDLNICNIIRSHDNKLLTYQFELARGSIEKTICLREYILYNKYYTESWYFNTQRQHNTYESTTVGCTNYDQTYFVCYDGRTYFIVVYEFEISLNKILESDDFDYHYNMIIQTSIDDDILYIYGHGKLYNNCQIVAHDIKTLKQLHKYEFTHDYPGMKLHKNKLYQYDYMSNKLYVYDALTMTIIYSHNIPQITQGYHELLISNDVIVFSGNNEMIIYHIK